MPHDLLWTIKKHNETTENTKEQLCLQKEMIITKRNVTKTWAGRWNFEVTGIYIYMSSNFTFWSCLAKIKITTWKKYFSHKHSWKNIKMLDIFYSRSKKWIYDRNWTVKGHPPPLRKKLAPMDRGCIFESLNYT